MASCIYTGLHAQHQLRLSDFLDRCSKNSLILSFVKIRPGEIRVVPWGADEQRNGRTERRTDMTKLMDAFRNFANAPKETVRTMLSMYSFI